ncbi:hypothetical protein SAMN05444003_1947 [Cognatiyoonia sediminum]|uniref:Malate transporter n=1 Tax=Cognatiyoonia sediminum TaxID=1508389 RepID=A0A1M5PYS6_9RHOB|nr:AEC family transporter [Cognatiyoonia sediminum]SHH07167.1 hypothetical protein SAMN05444003_1947 [Cognatiyoonia sediminum]
MIEVFLQTLPFFGVIGLGYSAGRIGFFGAEATAYLTLFVFYFALSAMLFLFAARLSIADVLDWDFVFAYLSGCIVVYLIATVVSVIQGKSVAEGAVEAQCAIIGNVGFLGIPMLALLLGDAAVGLIMVVLAIDLIVFSSLIVILITGSQDGKVGLKTLRTVGLGLVKNPLILSIGSGLLFASLSITIPKPAEEFLTILGGAATPGALFAIGASLAGKSAERVSTAIWLSICKLGLHPLAVAIFALLVFDVPSYAAGVMVACAALPVAGNVFMIAQNYNVAPARVSAAILFSTVASILTLPLVIAWVTSL